MKKYGLPSAGDKSVLVRRHKEYVLRHNANCDAVQYVHLPPLPSPPLPPLPSSPSPPLPSSPSPPLPSYILFLLLEPLLFLLLVAYILSVPSQSKRYETTWREQKRLWHTRLPQRLPLKRVSIFVPFIFVLFCFVLFCFVLFCFVLFCFVLFCFVLFCFVLFCFFFS